MTHTSTEQERATREDFEHWATSTNQGYDLTRNHSGRMQTYEHVKTEHAWRGFFHGWQAARRAQVVPHGWKLVPTEPTEDMTKAAWERGIREEAPDPYYAYKAMLAAAPQPPEAACNPSLQPELATKVAPVQLPEPVAEVLDMCGYNEMSYARGRMPPKGTKLYTEQQVRELLAAQARPESKE